MPAKTKCRLRKATCADCGYVIRVTRSWLEVGLPTCPCGGTIEPETAADRAIAGLIGPEDVPSRIWTAICHENGWEDVILRKGAAAKAWETRQRRESLAGGRKPRKGHCAFPGCGLWISDSADYCSHGHAQREDVPELDVSSAMPF